MANETNRPLTGWKAIASYFGKDERTVRRWAAVYEMPVHRVKGGERGAVFAYANDLDKWLVSHKRLDMEVDEVEQRALSASVSTAPQGRRYTFTTLAFACVVCLVMGGVVASTWPHAGRSAVEVADITIGQPSPAAESLYLDGVFHLETRTAEGLTRALGLFTQAVAADPDYAKAYVGLADAYNLISQYTPVSADESYPRAKSAADRAIALDPLDAGAYAALAFNAFYSERDLERAKSLFQKAVALDPANIRAHHWYALVAMQDRRFDVALEAISNAQRLDPRASSILANKGLILFHAGRTQEALDILRPLALTQPSLLSPHAYLATIYLATERNADFLREYRTAAALSGKQSAIAIADAAEAGFRVGGRRDMLTAMFVEQRRQFAYDREPAFKLALTAALLGDKSAALDFLDQSIKRREQDILGIRLEPALLGLHGDERYDELVEKAGLTR